MDCGCQVRSLQEPCSCMSQLFCLVIVIRAFLTSALVMIWVFPLLLQTYEKVATAFKSDEDVVIANLDADKYKDLAEK